MTIKKDNLRQQASKGAFWGLSSNLIVSMISFCGTIIMARILSPRDFGLIGMAVLLTGIVSLFGNLGLGTALVQKKEIDDEYLSTAFWASLIVGAGLTVTSIIIAPLASIFFKEPIVKWIGIILSVNFVVTSVSSVHRTLLYKDILLKKIAIIEVISRFVRVSIMLICAFLGMGFWSIVVGMMSEAIVKTLLFITRVKWRPVFEFNVTKFKELFHFGKNVYGQGFLNYLNNNMDFLVTGRLLGTSLFGFYQFSHNLPYLVKGYIKDGVAPVAFPVFSKVNSDKERLARGFFKGIKHISIMTLPIMFGLAFSASDFVAVAYGLRWLPAAEPMRLLAISAGLASINCLIDPVFYTVGRPDIGLKWSLIRTFMTIVLVMSLSKWGISGIALAMLIVESMMILTAYTAAKLLRADFRNYIIALLPAITGSLVMVIFLHLFNKLVFSTDNMGLRLMSNIVTGAVVYIVSLLLIYKKDLIDTVEFIRLSTQKY